MTNAELIMALAECYRLSGADPDGNEDWRLAEHAVAEVRRMREELEQAEARAETAEQERDAARAALRQVEWVGDGGYCPWCMGESDFGHAPNCARQRALEGE